MSSIKEEHFWTRDLQQPRNSRKIQTFASIRTVQQSEKWLSLCSLRAFIRIKMRNWKLPLWKGQSWRSTIPDFQAVLSSQLTCLPDRPLQTLFPASHSPQHQRLKLPEWSNPGTNSLFPEYFRPSRLWVSVATTQLCHCSTSKVAEDNTA